MAAEEETIKLELVYTLLCEDVRLEIGNKLSFMGVFQNIVVQQLPFHMFKLMVVNQWRGEGTYLTEVRILTPDRRQPITFSQPSSFEVTSEGVADNITFFANVVFPEPGQYWVQTLINSNLFEERQLTVAEMRLIQGADDISEAVN